jgi:hypothetical protein
MNTESVVRYVYIDLDMAAAVGNDESATKDK